MTVPANLDYATATATATATETEVRRAVLSTPGHPTILIISHRYSMVENTDYVVVLDAGVVIDQGRPAELIAHGGWFAEFARSGSVEH